MNVLSLFDGISCGQLALQRAGVQVSTYFASEVCPRAMLVTQARFPRTVQLGDVHGVGAHALPPGARIDLLLAGSPCQGFSRTGLQRGFDDANSRLYLEFLRILREVRPRFFLLENVLMRAEHRERISRDVGCEPVMINSRLFTAQNRQRLYWTNLPPCDCTAKTHRATAGVAAARRVVLADVIGERVAEADRLSFHRAASHRFGKRVQNGSIYAIAGKSSTLCSARSPMVECASDPRGWRRLTPSECEALQGVPRGYTKLDGAADAHRLELLCNAWTVDVIAHLLAPLVARGGGHA